MTDRPVDCFTSFSFSYLAKARVLAASLKKRHPNWRVWALIADREPDGFAFDIEKEAFDEVIWADELFGEETPSWLFKHDVIELCTAVKGPVLKRLAERGDTDRIFYFDPDISVFGSLQPMVDMLDRASILLTPHQIEPNDSDAAIFDNEGSSLRMGTYNLGFVGIRNSGEGLAFANWWATFLQRYCYDEPARGLFVDQKWCDLIPAFFDQVEIIRDPGYNVASWNLSRRKISIDHNGSIFANESPLRFFHFTKLGPIGDMMTQRYARDNVEVYELWSWYKRQVTRYEEHGILDGWWKYGHFSNGVRIPKSVRELYRRRKDLQKAFRDSFKAGNDSFYAWLTQEAREHLVGV